MRIPSLPFVLLAATVTLPSLAACSGGGSAGPVPAAPPTAASFARMPTDALARADVAASAATTTLLRDTFAGGSTANWTTAWGVWTACRAGTPTVEFCAGPGEAETLAGDVRWRDYTVAVALRPTAFGGIESAMGLLVRATDATHGYELDLAQKRDGYHEWIFVRRDGERHVTLGRGKSRRDVLGAQSILRLRAVGADFAAWISDDGGASFSSLATFHDATYAAGRIGLRTWGGLAGSFDDVTVTQPAGDPVPQPTPTLEPTATPVPVASPTALPLPTPSAVASPHPTGSPVRGTYVAPAGTVTFPTGPFAQPVSDPQILPESATYIDHTLGGDGHHFGRIDFATNATGVTDGSVPVYVAHESDPHYRIHCRYYGGCPLEGADVAIPAGARPAFNLGYRTFTDNGWADQHLVVRNLDTNVETDMWLAPQPSDVGGTLEVGYGGRYPFATGGIGQRGATASGFALTQGRIRPVDLMAGRIPGALFLVTPCENGHIWPASGDDGNGFTAGCPPLGAHVWLDSTPADIANSGAPADFKTILTALHEFGGYVGDRCGGGCSLNVQLEGGLGYAAFGLANPWAQIAAHFPGEIATGSPIDEYHIAVTTGSIDLRVHLHVIR